MMIKKGYIIIALAIVSVLLGGLFYSYITMADRTRESNQVEITNFPLDEEGNLRVRQLEPRTMTSILIDWENVTVGSWFRRFWLDVSGFQRIRLGAKVAPYGSYDQLGIYWFFVPEKNLTDYWLTSDYFTFGTNRFQSRGFNVEGPILYIAVKPTDPAGFTETTIYWLSIFATS